MLVYKDPLLAYLLVFVPSILTLREQTNTSNKRSHPTPNKIFLQNLHMSHTKKLSIESWLFNNDPYNG